MARAVFTGFSGWIQGVGYRTYLYLDLLLEAISHTSRTYLFDNSTEGVGQLWVAEITDGEDLELKCDPMPLWFQKAIWEKSGHTA